MTTYIERGYSSRSAYLQSVSEDYDVPLHIVQAVADLYGPGEDFDGLLAEMEDYNQ